MAGSHADIDTPADAAFTGTLILLIVGKRAPLVRVCRNRALAWVGTISYGLYLLHLPTAYVVRRYIEPAMGVTAETSTDTLLVIPAAIGVAYLSWTFFETPTLRLRSRLTAGESNLRNLKFI